MIKLLLAATAGPATIWPGQHRQPRSTVFDHPGRGRRIRVLDLDPVRRAPRAIGLVPPLGDDAFEPHAAGVTELRHDLATGASIVFSARRNQVRAILSHRTLMDQMSVSRACAKQVAPLRKYSAKWP